MKLKGQTAVVTGAGRGIGRAIAIEQAREGARVALVSRTMSEIEQVAAEINGEGGRAKPFALDITDNAAVEAAFAEIAGAFGPVDLLTNNAASFFGIGPIWEVDPDVWWRDVEINVRGTFNCCRAVVPQMIGARRGRIINMAGGGAGTSFPHGSGYATSKAGVVRFTESLNDSLKGTGVLAFAMDPGLVRTAMTEYQLSSKAGQTYLKIIGELFANGIDVPPDMAAQLSVAIGSGRFDHMAGRLFTAPQGDIDLDDAEIDRIVANDLRSLRVNGMPEERPRKR